MMEAAGSAFTSFLMRNVSKRPAAVLCGPGNNGGDGLVVARLLKEQGWSVRVGLLGEKSALKSEAALMASLYDGEVEPLSPAIVDGAGVIVDALFGTGLARPIEGQAREVIRAANAVAAPTFAVDIPSGVDADTGGALGTAIEAAATMTFISKKPGHLLFPGRALSGAVAVGDIGVKDEWAMSAKPSTFENHPALWAGRWRRPSFLTHKYDRGHVAVVSGPRLRTGAARLAAVAALRSGAGLVTVFSPKDAAEENAAHLTAVMLRETDEVAAIAEALADRRFAAALIGPGAGVGSATKERVLTILKSAAAAILDADALTSFEGDEALLFASLRENDVLTPHSGEFARLFADIDPKSGKVAAARRAAQAAKAIVVLKGADTVIAAPDGRALINTNAPYDLATAGAGDVLAGLIAGMRAQGMPGFEAAGSGVWLHGAAAQIAGPGLIAEDLPAALPQVFRTLFAPPQNAKDGRRQANGG
jgi:NAD(P)H-hydrate epimerase